MGTVTQYNLANVQAALGGGNPISMSEYYRGGPYVPTTRAITVREPTSGFYSGGSYYYDLSVSEGKFGPVYNTIIVWANVYIANTPVYYSSYTSGGYTYYPQVDALGFWPIYRTYPSTISINTGVPSSGTISIAQLFGAQNP